MYIFVYKFERTAPRISQGDSVKPLVRADILGGFVSCVVCLPMIATCNLPNFDKLNFDLVRLVYILFQFRILHCTLSSAHILSLNFATTYRRCIFVSSAHFRCQLISFVSKAGFLPNTSF